MIPLRNGVANVAEFRNDGKSILYPFNCLDESKGEQEIYEYKFQTKNSLKLKSDNFDMNLEIAAISPKFMSLIQVADGEKLTLNYMKIDTLSPLCYMGGDWQAEKSKHSRYQISDFVAAPYLPQSSNIDGFIGAWASSEGAIQFEIIKDFNTGNYKLFHAPSENWLYMFNDVTWAGKDIHYESFAYSEKIELFTHPYHKSKHRNIISLTNDPAVIKHVFFIGDQKYEYFLKRKIVKISDEVKN